MPKPPNTESPAALVNFIFRQLPDDVVDEIIQEAGGSGVPLESVIAVVGGSAVAAGQDTETIGLVQILAEDSSLPLPYGIGASSRGGRSGCRRKHVYGCVRRRYHYQIRE